MTKRQPLSQIAKLVKVPEEKLLKELVEAELLFWDEQGQLQPTPLGHEFEIEVLHAPTRRIILLPTDCSNLIAYLEKKG